MLDEIKEKAITYLLKGEGVSDVAKLVGKSRQAIYNWLDDEEFKAELDKRRQEIITKGNAILLAELNSSVERIKKIAIKSKSEKVKLDANTYLIDRVLGKTTTKVETNVNENDTNKVNDDILEQEFNEVDSKEE
jgi:SOS response regulatory protein OraA/RecX